MTSSSNRRGARAARKQMGEHTLEIIERGSYEAASGNHVRLEKQIRECTQGTQLFLDDELQLILAAAKRRIAKGGARAKSEVTQETTLEACARLARTAPGRVGALNFASARNPGGGFLNGSQAQEESLARSSSLYASQVTCQEEYYNFNRRQRTLLYSDRMIFSPDCPVFRHDSGDLLDEPYTIHILTSPAPNKGAIKQNKRSEINQVPAVFARRMELMLALFAHKGCTHLVLGAWGCGVFGNKPADVAQLYEQKIHEEGFGLLFEQITHAIYEPRENGPCFTAFSQAISP